MSFGVVYSFVTQYIGTNIAVALNRKITLRLRSCALWKSLERAQCRWLLCAM